MASVRLRVVDARVAGDRPVAVVTGGAGGIGRAAVERFVSAGWRAVVADVAPVTGSAYVLPVETDVRSADACAVAVRSALAWGGRIDVLVNAAGVWLEGPVEDTAVEDWDRVIDVNLKGTFLMCRAAIPALRATAGSVVNLASDAGLQANRGAAVYCASKGGVVLFTKTLALDLAAAGIRVNAVCPGDVMTPMLQGQAAAADDPEAYLARLLAGYAQGAAARFVQPAEVAELIWFLAQPAAAPITGAAISIDFGLSAGIL
jgi:NAD(P)-dependent dehydrogenase (short-subunit alcohol dehydrogenase family)